MSEDLSDEDFLFNYQTNRLNENPNDPFVTSILKRRNIILSLAHSSRSLDNATSCHIFEDQLQEYFNLVDERSGINNFAQTTLELMSNIKNVSKSWKSGLPKIPHLPDSWTSLQGNCVEDSGDGVCVNALPHSSIIPTLLAPPIAPTSGGAKAPAAPVQSTLAGFRKHPSYAPQAQGTGADRRTPVNSVQDFQKINNNSFLHENQLLPKYGSSKIRSKSALYSSYSDSVSLQPSQEPYSEQFPSKSYNKTKSFDWKNKKKNSLYSNYSDLKSSEPVEKSGIHHQFPGGRGYARNSKPIFTCGGFQSNISDESGGEPQGTDLDKHFKTATHELQIAKQKKFGGQRVGRTDYESGYERSSGFQPQVAIKKSLGGKRSVSSKFIPPVKHDSSEENYRCRENVDPETELDERLKNIDPKMVELIQNEIMDSGSKIDWNDIAGLEFAKSTIQEIVVWPMLRPDIFTGLRRPPKGILLFGPPGTGKTLIGKCIASQSNSTFFSISASSLTSKWIGDGEKMVRALFAVARCHQPAVVFIDEIDSLLSQRSDTEHESSRRIKTEFLVQLDGAATGEEDRILIIGATNRPQELDEAARRRLVKRLYIPLPDKEARKQLTQNLIKLERNDLTAEEIKEISLLTDGYSGADMKNLCQEASLGPIRSISSKDMFQISAEQVRPVNITDFKMALRRVKSSVSSQDLEIYVKWDQQYGSGTLSS